MKSVIAYFGSGNKLAGALDVSSAAVSQWVAKGHFPPLRAVQIEKITDGKVKAVDLIQGENNE